jgi:hypothetical protein
MKNLAIIIIAAFFALTNNSFAKNIHATSETSSCTWKSWFKYPKNNASYEEGKSIYVRVDPQKYHAIAYMELYVNGKFIRKESQYPYEWCKGTGLSDSYLRHLKKGTYKLKCKFKDKCGQYHEIYCTIYVKGHEGDHDPNPDHCDYKAWFKYPQNGKYFNPGTDVYVRLDVQNYHYIKYVELYVNGKFVRKESGYPYEWCKGSGDHDGYLRNLKPGTYRIKARVYDKCGKYKDYYTTIYVKDGNHDDDHQQTCKYKSWFKYPKNNATYKYGDDVYVRVDTEKYQHIAEMQLYINGNFVRKETQYPYEWCKGSGNSDSYLRNLKRGTYNLKVRVKTKCGKWYEYFCKFYVR